MSLANKRIPNACTHQKTAGDNRCAMQIRALALDYYFSPVTFAKAKTHKQRAWYYMVVPCGDKGNPAYNLARIRWHITFVGTIGCLPSVKGSHIANPLMANGPAYGHELEITQHRVHFKSIDGLCQPDNLCSYDERTGNGYTHRGTHMHL